MYVCMHAFISTYVWAPGVLGIWGEGLFIFRKLGSTCYYFYGAGEQAHGFRDLGALQKVKKIIYKSYLKGNASILFDKKKIFGFWGGGEGCCLPRPDL